MSDVPTLAEYCVTSCADAWRGDKELFASPMGVIPTLGARLARATFEPSLVLSDGEATLAQGTWGLNEVPRTAEGWMPFSSVFDIMWAGKRHVMMSPVQIDQFGNSNLSFIGPDAQRPRVQLLGARGAPGNTVNHATSYWVGDHSRRSFVAEVDMVSGVGFDRAKAAGPSASRYLDLRRVVSPLGVFDFATPDNRMRIVTLHPGITLEEVRDRTAFNLTITGPVETTRHPTEPELTVLRERLDPNEERNVHVVLRE